MARRGRLGGTPGEVAAATTVLVRESAGCAAVAGGSAASSGEITSGPSQVGAPMRCRTPITPTSSNTPSPGSSRCWVSWRMSGSCVEPQGARSHHPAFARNFGRRHVLDPFVLRGFFAPPSRRGSMPASSTRRSAMRHTPSMRVHRSWYSPHSTMSARSGSGYRCQART